MQRICNINFDRQNFKDFHLNGGFYASIAIFNNYIHSVAFKNMLVISSLKPKNQMALTIMCPRWFEKFLGRLLKQSDYDQLLFYQDFSSTWPSSFLVHQEKLGFYCVHVKSPLWQLCPKLQCDHWYDPCCGVWWLNNQTFEN